MTSAHGPNAPRRLVQTLLGAPAGFDNVNLSPFQVCYVPDNKQLTLIFRRDFFVSTLYSNYARLRGMLLGIKLQWGQPIEHCVYGMSTRVIYYTNCLAIKVLSPVVPSIPKNPSLQVAASIDRCSWVKSILPLDNLSTSSLVLPNKGTKKLCSAKSHQTFLVV